jgi:hypothetical protein
MFMRNQELGADGNQLLALRNIRGAPGERDVLDWPLRMLRDICADAKIPGIRIGPGYSQQASAV